MIITNTFYVKSNISQMRPVYSMIIICTCIISYTKYVMLNLRKYVNGEWEISWIKWIVQSWWDKYKAYVLIGISILALNEFNFTFICQLNMELFAFIWDVTLEQPKEFGDFYSAKQYLILTGLCRTNQNVSNPVDMYICSSCGNHCL